MQDDSGNTIFGTDLTWDQYDRLMYERVTAKWVEFERELFRAKWFDYRFMHPVAATYVAVHHYERAYRQAYARNVSRGAAEYIRVRKAADLFECPKMYIAGVWRARQMADAIGAPYDFAFEAAIRHTLRYWKREYLPRPEQIFHDRVCDAVVKEWGDAKRAKLIHSTHFEYRTHQYVGTRDQNDHHEHLMELATLRHDPAPPLTRFYDEELLPIEKIVARFGEDVALRVFEA